MADILNDILLVSLDENITPKERNPGIRENGGRADFEVYTTGRVSTFV